MAGWIGIDLGASRIRVAALGDAGGMLRIIPTPAPHALAHFVRAMRDAALSAGAPLSVGLARAPDIGPDGMIGHWPSRPDWTGVPLLSIIRHHTGESPSHLDDGAAAAGWDSADARNAGTTTASAVIGTGLAIGCARDGIPIHTGGGDTTPAHEHAGEWETPCRCGKPGCFQTVLNGGTLRAFMNMDKTHALTILGRTLENAEKLLRQRYGAGRLIISGNILLNPRFKDLLAESVSDRPNGRIIVSPTPHIAVIGGALLVAARTQKHRDAATGGPVTELRTAILNGLMKLLPTPSGT